MTGGGLLFVVVAVQFVLHQEDEDENEDRRHDDPPDDDDHGSSQELREKHQRGQRVEAETAVWHGSAPCRSVPTLPLKDKTNGRIQVITITSYIRGLHTYWLGSLNELRKEGRKEGGNEGRKE